MSGGISCEKDFSDIAGEKRCGGKIAGIITGKAFYEGKFDLAEVISKYQRDPEMVF